MKSRVFSVQRTPVITRIFETFEKTVKIKRKFRLALHSRHFLTSSRQRRLQIALHWSLWSNCLQFRWIRSFRRRWRGFFGGKWRAGLRRSHWWLHSQYGHWWWRWELFVRVGFFLRWKKSIIEKFGSKKKIWIFWNWAIALYWQFSIF